MQIDKYNLEKIIGKGGFSEVYLTSVKDDQIKYATKVYKRDELDKFKEVNNIYSYLCNEITILKDLNHSNILKLHDIKKTKKNYYVIFEYCNGEKLSEALQKYIEINGKPFTEEIVQHLMKQIIDAFKYMHEKKIIHRNVKIDGIFLNYENEEDAKNHNLMKAQIKITEFGFAYRYSKYFLNHSFLDPVYNSKKKYRSAFYDDKSDIWKIGAMCYEMLIGKPVFDDEARDKLVRINKQEEKKLIYYFPTNMSFEVTSFINGMLQYEPEKRLTLDQLSRHDFLIKNVSQFKKIDLEKVSDKVNEDKIQIDAIHNSTIWSIFNKKDEDLLSSILGSDYVKPIDKKEEVEFSKAKENLKESSVKLPIEGKPNNPTNKKMPGLSKEEFDEMKKLSNENGDDFTDFGNVFDN